MDFTHGQKASIDKWIAHCDIRGKKKDTILIKWKAIEKHRDFLRYIRNGTVHDAMDRLVWALFAVNVEEVSAVAESRKKAHAGLKNKRDLIAHNGQNKSTDISSLPRRRHEDDR